MIWRRAFSDSKRTGGVLFVRESLVVSTGSSETSHLWDIATERDQVRATISSRSPHSPTIARRASILLGDRDGWRARSGSPRRVSHCRGELVTAPRSAALGGGRGGGRRRGADPTIHRTRDRSSSSRIRPNRPPSVDAPRRVGCRADRVSAGDDGVRSAAARFPGSRNGTRNGRRRPSGCADLFPQTRSFEGDRVSRRPPAASLGVSRFSRPGPIAGLPPRQPRRSAATSPGRPA